MKNQLAFFLLLIFCSCQSEEYFEDGYCITNVTTIDAKSGVQSNQTVVVENERILKIEDSKSLRLSPKNKIIDGSGKFLIPGLWDGHVHFAFIEELAPKMFDLFLGHGVTSVRDTGGKIDFLKKWKDKADANSNTSPRVKIAGPLLDGMPNVYDGSSPERPQLSVGLATVEDAIKMIDQLTEKGVDLLKAYEMLTPEQLHAIVAHAKKKGLTITGHIPLSMDAISASNAGMHCMEHLRNIEFSTARQSDELLKMRQKMLELGQDEEGGVLRSKIHKAQRELALYDQDETRTQEVIATLAKNQTWQCPTLSVMVANTERFFDTDEWRASFDYLPPTVGERWSEGLSGFLKTEVDTGRARHASWMFSMLKKLSDSNVPIIAGTDCPIFYLTPGLSLHGELELMAKSGMTNETIFKSATYSPAKYFGMENELGLISEGYLADLILLDANPLDNISNTKKINTVIKNGQVYDKKQLAEILKR